MPAPTPPPPPHPDPALEQITTNFADLATPESRHKAIGEWLLAALEAAIIIPLLFTLENLLIYQTFQVSDLGWGITLFFVLYCLLWALGIFFFTKTQYHATTAPRTKLAFLDKIAGFWLIACAFGPFFGWIITSGTIPITPATWRWLYAIRAVLVIVLPILCILPMIRYIRGKAALIQLPLLLGITLLPVMSGLHVAEDLITGPIPRIDPKTARSVPYLPHTQKWLSA